MQDINYHGMRLIKIKVHKETSDFFFCIVACLQLNLNRDKFGK